MCEEGAARLDDVDPLQRLVDMSMGLVRPIKQRADDPCLDPCQSLEGFFVQFDHIGGIRHGAEPETHGFAYAVILFEDVDIDIADGQMIAGGNVVRIQGRLVIKCGTFGEWFQHISESFADLGHCIGVGIDIDGLFHGPVYGPQIIDSVQVIGMIMGEQHAIEAADLGIQQLLAQIG